MAKSAAAKRGDDGGLSPVLRTCDAVGRLMEFWGFSRHLGRIWALLFLSPNPRTAAEVQEELQVSAGASSTYLRELLRWGVVRKVWVPGERKDFFEAETDLWKMVSRVFEEREEKLIEHTRSAFEDAAKELEASARERTADAEERALSRFQAKRVGELKRMTALAETLLQTMIRRQKVDVSPLDRDLAKPDAGA